MGDIFIGAGSNIEPEKHILLALDRLVGTTSVTGVSMFYWSDPLGRPKQPRFLNGVFRIETALAAMPLKFDLLRGIETDLGRERTPDRYAARTIDLDILLYDREVIDEPDLKIPDPDITERPFVAVPLLDLDPALVMPGTGKRLSSLVSPEGSRALIPAEAFTGRLRARIGQGTKNM